ncbi:MAG: M23 family metallopeptidase [Vicinamibacterales bacterium]
MRSFVKFILSVVVLAAIVAGGAWVWAGRQPGPAVTIRGPEKFVGQAGSLDVMVESPGGQYSAVTASVEQEGKTYPVFSLDPTSQPAGADENANRLYVSRPIGKRTIPELKAGPARIVVTASRPVLYGRRLVTTTVTRDVQVRLDPPRVGVLSTFHYINHGGAEFVVYTATPPDVESGVRVGQRAYRGFPGSAVGLSDPSVHVAFFALLNDQTLNEPISVYARDEAGNQATAALDHMPFEKPFARSRIQIDDRFLQKVVPPIVDQTPDMGLSSEPDKLLESFLKINGELRRRNAQTIAELATKSAPEMMWKDAFQPLSNAAVEARFADGRTYVYQGKDVDQQVHLGFDLAVTAQVPIQAAQRGVVVHAAYLGIYGNCVILDHGLGVQTLYGHMSSLDVKPGDQVEKGQVLGRSGTTGLAAGDHLHFTVLVGGSPVNAVEWWDPKWMQDRVFRKIQAAGGAQPSVR